MEEQVQVSKEDAMMAREELSANQHVLKMLHNKMDLLLQEIHTLYVWMCLIKHCFFYLITTPSFLA